MATTFTCPTCNAKLRGPDQLRGTTLKCPRCLTHVTSVTARRFRIVEWLVEFAKHDPKRFGAVLAAILLVAVSGAAAFIRGSAEQSDAAALSSDSATKSSDNDRRRKPAVNSPSAVPAKPVEKTPLPEGAGRPSTSHVQKVASNDSPRRASELGLKRPTKTTPPVDRSENPQSRNARTDAQPVSEVDWPELRAATRNARWPAPQLTDQNYIQWLTFIRPSEQELKWRDIRWHSQLSEAAVEARRLQRPILLWTMNGHPCGET